MNVRQIHIKVQPFHEKISELLPIFQELERQNFGKFHNNYYICPTMYSIHGIGVLNNMFEYCRMRGINNLMFIIKKDEEKVKS